MNIYAKWMHMFKEAMSTITIFKFIYAQRHIWYVMLNWKITWKQEEYSAFVGVL